MDRRRFLQALGLAAASVAAEAVLDPERLLWVAGAKTIFLPPVAKPEVYSGWVQSGLGLQKGDIITIAGVYARNPLSMQEMVETGCLQQFVVTDAVEGRMRIWPDHIALPVKPQIQPTMVGKYTAAQFTWNGKPQK